MFEIVLLFIAAISTILFLIQLVISFMGLGHDLDIDHGDGFHVFTYQNFVAFFTMFGWTGLASLKNGYSPTTTIMVALLAGIATVAVISSMFFGAEKLKEDNTFDVNDVVGMDAQVYLTIPKNNSGMGKVMVTFGSRKELGAVTSHGEDLVTDSFVRIKSVTNSDILVVEPR